MRCKVITVVRNEGKSNKTGRSYNFQMVGALIRTAKGTEFAELMLDGEAATPESGKEYDIGFSFYPDREKRLQFRVEQLVPVTAPAPTK